MGRERAMGREQRPLRSFVLFGLAGGMATGGYFLVLYGLETGLSLDYRLATSGAYMASAAVHFMANRYLTFRSTGHAAISFQLLRYGVLLVMNYLINLTTVIVCVEQFGWSAAQGVVLSILFTLVAGFLLARKWVFARPEGVH